MARTSRERGGACPAGGRRSSCPRQTRSRHLLSRILPSMAARFVINDGEDCHYLRQPIQQQQQQGFSKITQKIRRRIQGVWTNAGYSDAGIKQTRNSGRSRGQAAGVRGIPEAPSLDPVPYGLGCVPRTRVWV